jgi:succinate dehydrogenase flavin-adding protein (antitoxin of CptAB toxin-antitoxin module)
MTRYDVIKQMNIEDLAFFLSIVEWGDLNSIPNITNEDIDYYKNYLKEEDNDLIDALHKLNKSRHDYKETEDVNNV